MNTTDTNAHSRSVTEPITTYEHTQLNTLSLEPSMLAAVKSDAATLSPSPISDQQQYRVASIANRQQNINTHTWTVRSASITLPYQSSDASRSISLLCPFNSTQQSGPMFLASPNMTAHFKSEYEHKNNYNNNEIDGISTFMIFIFS